MDQFANDALLTVCTIVKIVLLIVLRVKKVLLPLSLFKFILIILLAMFIPMGGTIAFIILKVTGFLPLSWWWILLTISLDGSLFPAMSTWF